MRQMQTATSVLLLQRRPPSERPQIPHPISPSPDSPSLIPTRPSRTYISRGCRHRRDSGLPIQLAHLARIWNRGLTVRRPGLLGHFFSSAAPGTRLIPGLHGLNRRICNWLWLQLCEAGRSPSLAADPARPRQYLPQVFVPHYARDPRGPAPARLPSARAAVDAAVCSFGVAVCGYAYPVEIGRSNTYTGSCAFAEFWGWTLVDVWGRTSCGGCAGAAGL